MTASLATATTLIGVVIALAGAAVLLGASTGAAVLAAGVALTAFGLLGIDIDRPHR